MIPAGFWDRVVNGIKLCDRDRLAGIGACLLHDDETGHEALRLSSGCWNFDCPEGTWLSLGAANLRMTDPEAMLFIDPGNMVYAEFLRRVLPQAQLHSYMHNVEKLGDVVECTLGIVAVKLFMHGFNWSFDPRVIPLLRAMSRVCLAAFVDYHCLGTMDFSC